MSDKTEPADDAIRPYPPTEWEEDVAHDAVVGREEIVDQNVAQQHSLDELVESSKEISASAEAVSNLTKEALISENTTVRRRNTVLTIIAAMILTSSLFAQVRYYAETRPQDDEIVEHIEELRCLITYSGDSEAIIECVEAINPG